MKPNLYTRMYLWLVAHRPVVLGITLLITAVSVVISMRINMDDDILEMLPRNDKLVDEYRYTIKKFRQIDRVYFDVGINADDPDRLALAADEVFAALSTNAAYERIMYRIEVGGQQKIIGYLTGALPNLFTDADATALIAKLDPAAVRAHLTDMRRKLAGPEGMVLKDVVAADPVGMSELVVNKVLPLQTGFGDAQIVDGRITSGDGRHVLIMAQPKIPSSNSKASTILVAEILDVVRAVEKDFPGVHVAVTGGHRMSVDNATMIKADATRCISIGTAGILLLCLVAYRRRWLAVITLLPSLFSTLIAGVVISLWQNHLSAIVVGFASIAVGITVDYAIHIIYHLDDAAGSDRRAVGKHLSRLVFPIVLGALTTIAAFAVMTGSPMHGYQQLGIFGIIGVIFSVAFALVILPLLVPIAKTPGQPRLWLTRWWETYFNWQSNKRVWLLVFVVLLTIVTAMGVRKLRFEGDISKLNGITDSTRDDEALINKTWGSALGMTMIVARGATPEEALVQNDRAAEILAHDTNVAAIYSLASVAPSSPVQQANIRRWHGFWTTQRQNALRQTLQQVGTELGYRPDAFAKFWENVEGEPALFSFETFHETPLEQALTERVAVGTNDTAISTLIKLNDRANVESLREALPGVIVLDGKAFTDHVAGLAKSGLGNFALWTGIVVAVILYLTLMSLELVFATVIPLAFGLLWTFGLMGWLGLPIDLMNSIFVIFIIGIGEDYSVFLVTSRLEEWRGQGKSIAATSASVLISALTTIFGFGVMVLANHPVLFSMGTTVLIGMVFTFIATLILTPLCMELLLFKNPPRGAPRWWHLLGTVWGGLYLLVSQIIVFGIFRSVMKLVSPSTADRRVRQASQLAMSLLVKPFPFGKTDYQNFTAETFTRPAIVISNHQSAVDVLAVFIVSSELCMTVKKRVWDTPILGIACKSLGHVVVEPNRPTVTLERCRSRLNAGLSLHFFPEGTRSKDGYVQRFHRGAFELAIDLKQEILPIVLCDTITAMPRDAYWFEPYHATVRALPRVTPQNFDYSQGSLALMRHCETVVREALQRQLDEINTPRVVCRKVGRLYRYQGKYVEQFVFWKMKCDPMFAALDSVVPRAGFVLDLGCGYGMATHWLSCFTDRRTFLGIDYDEDKIRVAQRTAPDHPRIKFESGDILNAEYPACDVVLLLDVLHYWTPEKQQLILTKARQALRPGGRLILRDGARSETEAHRNVHRWEKFATRTGMNRTKEGLHFLTLAEMETALKNAGFASWEIKRDAGNDSNVMLVALA